MNNKIKKAIIIGLIGILEGLVVLFGVFWSIMILLTGKILISILIFIVSYIIITLLNFLYRKVDETL